MIVYVCSQYGGIEENYQTAKRYGKYVVSKGNMAIIPHTMLHGIVDDRNPEERIQALELGKKLMTLCDEVWVFGGKVSPGMEGEITEAARLGKTIKYVKCLPTASVREEAITLCLTEYNKYFNGLITPVISEDIAVFIKQGVSDKLITHCMGIAARRQRPWIYCKRILERCVCERIYTLEEFEAGKAAKKQNQMATYDAQAVEEILKKGGTICEKI